MLKEITITFTGDYHAFAVLTDTFEQAYVPNSVVSAANLEVGRKYRAGVVENRHDRSGQTPWFITFAEAADLDASSASEDESVFSPLRDLFEEQVEEDEVEDDALPELTVSDIVRAAVPAMSGEPFIASELAAVAGVENSDAGTVLNNMFISGDISCAKVFKTSGQSKASQTVWCTDVRRLLK
jgi:hypothetical protein